MKVFISWSGQLGGAIGKEFKDWLPAVIQALRPYFSPDDISKGTRWATEISKELEASAFGLIITTKEALESDWVMFEAGALSKNIDKARVIPILFSVESTDVTGPLVQFQGATFSKDDIFRTLSVMNAVLGTSGLTDTVLKSVFEMWWPKLDEAVQKLLASKPVESVGSIRSDRDLIEELLTLVRAQRPAGRTGISRSAIVDLVGGLQSIYQLGTEGIAMPDELMALGERMEKPIRYIARSQLGSDFETMMPEVLELKQRLRSELDEQEVLENEHKE